MTTMTYVKMLLALLLVIAVVVGGKALHDKIYDNGVQAERAVWLEAQAKADEQERVRKNAELTDSFDATDKAAAQAEDVSRGTQAATDASLERINYVYVKDTSKAAGCTPAGDPAPIPVDVLRELDLASEAVRAAGAP